MEKELYEDVAKAIRCGQRSKHLDFIISRLKLRPAIFGAEKWERKHDPTPPTTNGDILMLYIDFFDLSSWPFVTGDERVKKYLAYLDMVPDYCLE